MASIVDRLNTALEGRYAIVRLLGEGGVATVYLAKDFRHSRQVALKLLKPELAAVLRADRFLAEIKAATGLQHPHILPLYDSGEADGLLFYVTPYVEGESLRDRLDKETQLPVADAVHITATVASALDYAHRHGVIHRDIKPENILLHDDQPVVADFGIALAVSVDGGGGGRLTETGLSLGTPLYMSPEQASADQEIGPSSDVYALACVSYEMLAGEPPHGGPTVQAILSKLLTEEPRPVRRLRKSVPEHVEAALIKALQKLPADRFSSADAFASALADPGFRTPLATALESYATVTARRREPSAAVLPWALVVVMGLVGGVAYWSARGTPPPVMTLPASRIVLPIELGNGSPTSWSTPAVSPDGRLVAYSVTAADSSRLFLHALDEFEPRHVGSDAWAPFFSPDGRWLGFFGPDDVWKTPVDSWQPTRVGPRPQRANQGANPDAWWSPTGRIIVSGGAAGLWALSEDGGDPELLVGPDAARGEKAFTDVGPFIDNRPLFTIETSSGFVAAALNLDDGGVRRLAFQGSGVRYVGGNRVLYEQEGTWLVRRIDPATFDPVGDPIPVFRRSTPQRVRISRAGTAVFSSLATDEAQSPFELRVVQGWLGELDRRLPPGNR